MCGANLTSRTNRFWTQPDDGYTATWVNDRNTARDYDSTGNIKHDTMNHNYDLIASLFDTPPDRRLGCQPYE
jgi:hypothetical protein